MRKLIFVVVLSALCVGLSGCFIFDKEHNRHHWQVIKKDIMLLHEDIDWILCLDEESPLDTHFR